MKIFLILWAASTIFGQAPTFFEKNEEYALQPIVRLGSGGVMKSTSCGRYFNLMQDTTGHTPDLIFFNIKAGEGSQIRRMGVQRVQITTEIMETGDRPIAVVTGAVMEDRHPRTLWTIRLSSQEFQTARRCLSEPTKKLKRERITQNWGG